MPEMYLLPKIAKETRDNKIIQSSNKVIASSILVQPGPRLPTTVFGWSLSFLQPFGRGHRSHQLLRDLWALPLGCWWPGAPRYLGGSTGRGDITNGALAKRASLHTRPYCLRLVKGLGEILQQRMICLSYVLFIQVWDVPQTCAKGFSSCPMKLLDSPYTFYLQIKGYHKLWLANLYHPCYVHQHTPPVPMPKTTRTPCHQQQWPSR